MDNEVFNCKKCDMELTFEECHYFGNWREDRKVWCDKCFSELKEYLQKKYFEETIPTIKKEALEVLKKFEEKKKEFTALISRLKRFISVCEKKIPIIEVNEFIEKQNTLGEISNG